MTGRPMQAARLCSNEEVKRTMEYTCYENRELSWLRFNERVLEEAEDEQVPLCERLNFLSIFQSNLDEFFMVRIGSLHDQMLLDRNHRENKTHMTAGEQIDGALAQVRQLCRRRDLVYDELLQRVAKQGITLVDFRQIGDGTERYLKRMFVDEYMPLLSTFIIGKKQSFPFLKNREIYAVAVLSTKSDKRKIGVVPCGGDMFPRLIPIPERPGSFMLAEELILHYMAKLFAGYKVRSKTLARVTRNADIDADRIGDEELNYRDHMAEIVKLRRRLCPVRMELSRAIDPLAIRELCSQMKLETACVFSYESPLDLSFLYDIQDALRGQAELFYAPRHPQECPDLRRDRPVLDQILEKDVMLHYPYQSMNPFLRLLSEAAQDERVVSIKMTLYRLARNSKVVESLAEAAENGKQVDVLVELKARFDEENNIQWSRRLERAGCHVIYGLDGFKVHSKLCLITLRTGEGIRYVTQVGTGNYNEKTSRLYTDLSVMTGKTEIGQEGAAVFHALTLGETLEHTAQLLVAPHCLQSRLLELIDGEIAKANRGRKGYIRLKINSLSDKVLIDKLIEASQAGVHVDMIVRGICCLRSGVPGQTENIRVISIVGRYLEHSRIYLFGEGEEASCYISSADWMTRNTQRRVEVALPVTDPALHRRLERIFQTMWQDNCQARVQQPDGTYRRRRPEEELGEGQRRACQDILYGEAYQAAHHERTEDR